VSFRALDYLRAVRDAPLGKNEKAVLVWLLSYADVDGKRCFPSIDTIASAAGMSRATVCRALGTLRESGEWFTVTRASRTSVNTYELVAKSHPETSQPATSPAATSQPDTCEVSPGDVRSLTLRPATSHPETRSAHLPAHLPAQVPAHTPTAPPALVVPDPESSKSQRPSRAKPRTSAPTSDATPAEVTAWAIRWTIPEADTEFPNFLDHHRKKGDLFADWTAAWRTWLRSPYRQARTAILKTGFAAQQPPPGGSVWHRKEVLS
jgi:helix-turn-helix protein